MQNKSFWYYFMVVLFFFFTSSLTQSCREESDDILSYDGYSPTTFYDAGKSFQGQFNAVWTALNCNYALWDFESELGLDWNAVYDKYLPKFAELDNMVENGEIVGNDIIQPLYEEFLSPLHDGHLQVNIKNTSNSEGEVISFMPSLLRNRHRDEFYTDSLPFDKNTNNHLQYYYLEADADSKFIEHKEASSLMGDKWDFDYAYGRFGDNILYYRIKQCKISECFSENYSSDEEARQIWKAWFSTIQELHGKANLKGLIIDLRNNLGGVFSDYKYILGCLQTYEVEYNGDKFINIGWQRAKNGVGRLDYAPIIPFRAEIYDGDHAIIDEPVVILANTYTVSMAEIICLSAKYMENAIVAGTRTWGGLCALNDDYRQYYAGTVGAINGFGYTTTPFYAYIPSIAFFDKEMRIVDGIGIEPDIYVPFDVSLYEATGRDSQLERALQYIRTGK